MCYTASLYFLKYFVDPIRPADESVPAKYDRPVLDRQVRAHVEILGTSKEHIKTLEPEVV